MQLNRLIIFAMAAVFLLSCSSEHKPDKPDETTTKVYKRGNLGPCIAKELYYDTSIDMDTYEAISIQYFREIKDYTSKRAQKILDDINYRLLYLDTHLAMKGDEYLLEFEDSLQYEESVIINEEIDSLQELISPYRKEVVGYVFVHTFKTANDTQSVIFLMDTKCITAEAIPIHTVPQDINPDDYLELIRAQQ